MNNGLLIQGKNVHVYKYISASPFEIVCGTDVIFEINQETIGVTTPDSGKFRELTSRLRGFTCTISGATTSDNDGNLSVFHFPPDGTIDDVQDIEVVYTDNDGNNRSLRANFIIETLSITGPADGASTYDIRMIGTGDYATTALIDPEIAGANITSDSYTIAGGVIQDNNWIGLTDANIIEVCREGTEQLSMNLPYTFNPVTGEITPDPATTEDGQKMFVIWTF